METRAAWRGAYSADLLRINGPYTIAYSRQSLETAESISKRVYEDRLDLSTEARVLDRGVLLAEIFGEQRTDGNRTLGAMIWQARPLEKQPEITAVDSIMASPRFEGGRNALLNLCVDDTVNAPVWRSLVPAAGKLGLKITLALNTDALSPQYWKMIIPEVNAGFEVASHDLGRVGGMVRRRFPAF